MDTFDLNYTPNHTKLGASVNAKCLFPVTGRIGPVLDSTCSSDEKYFRCNILLRPTFPLIIHNELNQYLCLNNYFRLWKKKKVILLLKGRGGKKGVDNHLVWLLFPIIGINTTISCNLNLCSAHVIRYTLLLKPGLKESIYEWLVVVHR